MKFQHVGPPDIPRAWIFQHVGLSHRATLQNLQPEWEHFVVCFIVEATGLALLGFVLAWRGFFADLCFLPSPLTSAPIFTFSWGPLRRWGGGGAQPLQPPHLFIINPDGSLSFNNTYFLGTPFPHFHPPPCHPCVRNITKKCLFVIAQAPVPQEWFF